MSDNTRFFLLRYGSKWHFPRSIQINGWHNLLFSWRCQRRQLYEENQDSLGLWQDFCKYASWFTVLCCCQDQDFLKKELPPLKEKVKKMWLVAPHALTMEKLPEGIPDVWSVATAKTPLPDFNAHIVGPSCGSRLKLELLNGGPHWRRRLNKRADWGTRCRPFLQPLFFVHLSCSLNQS